MNVLQGERLIERSASLANELHAGQEHFFGDDTYFNMHLQPVAGIIRRLGYGALYVATGYLHDSIEDISVTARELRAEGIPTEVVHAVDLLAKKEGQTHEQYLAGITTSNYAIVGKYGDSSFNYSWTMLNSPDIGDDNFRNWGLEYAHNIATLLPLLPPPDNK